MNLFKPFFTLLSQFDAMQSAVAPLEAAVDAIWQPRRNGNIPRFMNVLNRHPYEGQSSAQISQAVVTANAPEVSTELLHSGIRQDLKDLMPWRKGPFQINDLVLDAEWRCDQKWSRFENAVDFEGKHVLDIGSGNGYYALRCAGRGARTVTAIDPSVLSVTQFHYMNRYLNRPEVSVLPLALEDLPQKLPVWDIALSMGVLYHRKSPFEHLESIRDKLVPGGTLVLETLVIDGDIHTVLVPENRYAMMNNVYFLPSVALLVSWLRKAGFESIQVVSVTTTDRDEQRNTEWKAGTSLDDYLDAEDPTKTIEGHPIPTRAIVTAVKPVAEKKLPRYHLK